MKLKLADSTKCYRSTKILRSETQKKKKKEYNHEGFVFHQNTLCHKVYA